MDIEKKRKYQREWVAARRAEFFSDKICVVCGSTENLELDHIDPTLKISHKIFSWSKERREAEIAKCQVLCDPCHENKTHNRVSSDIHGTWRGYGREKCRCPKCITWNNDRKKRQRA